MKAQYWSTQLRLIRESTSLSQSEFATKIGVTRVTVCRVETGGAVPSKKVLDAWLAACGETVESRPDIVATIIVDRPRSQVGGSAAKSSFSRAALLIEECVDDLVSIAGPSFLATGANRDSIRSKMCARVRALLQDAEVTTGQERTTRPQENAHGDHNE